MDYYLIIAGFEYGPLDAAQVSHLVAHNRLFPHDLIRIDEGPWAPAGSLTNLFPEAPLSGASGALQPAMPIAQPVAEMERPTSTGFPEVRPLEQPPQNLEGTNLREPRFTIPAPEKSVALAVILAILLGPFGMLYSTVVGAVAIFMLNYWLIQPSRGVILLLTLPAGCIWAGMAAYDTNKSRLRMMNGYLR